MGGALDKVTCESSRANLTISGVSHPDLNAVVVPRWKLISVHDASVSTGPALHLRCALGGGEQMAFIISIVSSQTWISADLRFLLE